MNKINYGKLRIIFHVLLGIGLLTNLGCSISYADESQTLPQLNQSTVVRRIYEFTAGEKVTLEENMGSTAPGTFNIIGKNKSENSILFNSYSGFYVNNIQTTLTINDVTISGARSNIGAVILNTASDSSITLKNMVLRANSATSEGNTYGGAIYSNSEITLTNVSFIGNSATATTSGSEAKGGAIYANNSLSIIADSENVEIVDNYVQDGDGNKTNNAIYMNNADSTLTLGTQNGGKINLHDNIDGQSGYKVRMAGDGTGTIGVYNDIKNGEVSVSNVNVSFIDGKTENRTIDNLSIGGNTNFMLDADLANSEADTLTSANGEGTMYVSDLSVISAPASDSVTVQVLKNAGNIVLNIDRLNENRVSELQATMYNNSILADSISLATTTTANDSITIVGWKDTLYELMKDTNPLHMIKNFVFRTDAEYTLTQDLETIPQESIITIYNISDAERGVINADGHSLFKLVNPISSITLRDIEIKNASTTQDGGVVYLENTSSSFTADNSVFDNNSADGNGGAFVAKNGTLSISNSTVSNNSAGGDGGAIYTTENATVQLVNVDFKDNTSDGNGGAIYAGDSTVIISASNGTSTFEGNSANGENNAIYVGSTEANVTLKADDNGTINMNDKISGINGYNLNITGTKKGDVNINNAIENANITFSGTNLNLSQDDWLKGDNLTTSGGTINLINNHVGNMDLNSLTVNKKTNISVDVDLKNATMDRINANNYVNIKGKINVSKMNILTETKEKVTKIFFADPGLRRHVTTPIKKVAYSRVYRYLVSYSPDTGYFTFGRDYGHNDYHNFNPAVLSGSMTQQIAYMNMLQEFQTVRYHSDTYMSLPKWKRKGKLINSQAANIYDDMYTPTYVNIPEEVHGIWIRPYASFERIPIRRGPKVDAISYGTYFGGDSDLIELGHGYSMVYGGFVGYVGNSYSYEHIDATQQGVSLGANVNIYKGNFYNSLVLGTGWQINNSDTQYGTDTLHQIMAGFSDKFGYNFELMNGKLIIQPSIEMGLVISYLLDYKTSGGVNIKSTPLYAVPFIPSLKFIGNLSNGWQPYFTISLVTSFFDRTSVNVDGERLPSMYLDPYLEYGIGLQKRWADKYSGFAQATVRHGGRRGASLLFGFRCMLGKLSEKTKDLLHADPKPKQAIFKERKDPNIVVDTVSKRPSKPKKEPDENKKTFSLREALRSLKDRIFYRYNTDVSAKVVTDVYPDGVIMPSINDNKSKKLYSLDYKDKDRIEPISDKPSKNVKSKTKTPSVSDTEVKPKTETKQEKPKTSKQTTPQTVKPKQTSTEKVVQTKQTKAEKPVEQAKPTVKPEQKQPVTEQTKTTVQQPVQEIQKPAESKAEQPAVTKPAPAENKAATEKQKTDYINRRPVQSTKPSMINQVLYPEHKKPVSLDDYNIEIINIQF